MSLEAFRLWLQREIEEARRLNMKGGTYQRGSFYDGYVQALLSAFRWLEDTKLKE